MGLHKKAPTPASIERSILTYLRQQSAPVRPSSLFSTREVSTSSTASERRRALWNLVDTGKVVLREDRTVEIVVSKK